MDKPESIFSFLAALLTAIGSFLGLLRISPDWFPAFGKSSISSINSKFEETTLPGKIFLIFSARQRYGCA